MAITYIWDCKTVDTYPTKDGKSDVIFNVHWKLNGEDDTEQKNNGTYYSSSIIDTSDLSNFKEFSDLTNEDVTNWVVTILGEDKVKEIKSHIDAQIAEKVTPTKVTKTIGV
jgi:hypothetical protein